MDIESLRSFVEDMKHRACLAQDYMLRAATADLHADYGEIVLHTVINCDMIDDLEDHFQSLLDEGLLPAHERAIVTHVDYELRYTDSPYRYRVYIRWQAEPDWDAISDYWHDVYDAF